MKAGLLCANAYSVPSALKMPPPISPKAYDPVEGQRSLKEAFEQARLADELGFDLVSVSEHHSMALILTPNAAVFAAALSQVLKKAAIGWFGPLVSINNPIRIAEEIAMLDQLTNGRLWVCPLRGTPNEFQTYNNVTFAESRPKTEEATLLIRRALTEPDCFAHKGEFFDFPKVALFPGPTQKPCPPMYSSGGSEDSVRFAARNRFRLAISFYPPPLVAKLTALYREEAAKAGWTPTQDDILYRAFCVVGENDAHAMEMRQRFFVTLGDVDVSQPSELGTDADGKVHAKADKGAVGFGLGFLQFYGGPKTVIEQIRSLNELAGVGTVDLGFGVGGLSHAETMNSIRRFGEQVLPQIRNLHGSKAAKVSG